MRNGWLDEGDASALSRQAVDLLDVNAAVTFVDESAIAPYNYLGSMYPTRSIYSICVDVGSSKCVIRLDSGWTPSEALGNLISELSAACGGRYRGKRFPPCPGHDHTSEISVREGAVLLVCPATKGEVERIVPEH